jgi:hypothetical protein
MSTPNSPALWRTVLRADAHLALALGTTGALTASMQAAWTALPPGLHVGASLLLLLYAGAAYWASRPGPRARGPLWGLVVFNAAWALTALGLALGDVVSPTALGLALLAAHVVLPGGVAAVLWLDGLTPAHAQARASS